VVPVLSAGLTGLILAAPDALNRVIPNWQTTLGPILLLLAAFALLSLLLRSFFLVVQIAFWLGVIAVIGGHTGIVNSQLADRLSRALPNAVSAPTGWVDIFTPPNQSHENGATEESKPAETQGADGLGYRALLSGFMPAENGSQDRFISEGSLPDAAYLPHTPQRTLPF